MASNTGSSSRFIVRVATSALLSFALLLPANAQFWGNSWGGCQQQPQQPYNPYAQQPYNPYGGFGVITNGATGIIASEKGPPPPPEETAQGTAQTSREGAAPGLWPRGMVNVEPATADLTAPDTAARMPAPNPPSPPSASRRWMLTPLKRAGSRSRSSAGRGLVSNIMRGLTSARISHPSGRVAGSTHVCETMLSSPLEDTKT